MHRFPNPGSDIKNSIESLRFLMNNINSDQFFDLFDMKELLVLNGFISSSGATGVQALIKSENIDRSRDQTFNQCKMYAEIYRALGWISSVDKALDYHISLFGRHALSSKLKPQVVFEYCLLGIENPNGILKIDRQYRLRPFLAILKCAYKLGGYISRDEMIYGPLFLRDDTNEDELNKVCKELLSFRGKKGKLEKELNCKYEERKIETGRGFTKTTAENYTRFPIAAIQWVNWFTKCKNSFYLTDYGLSALKRANLRYDLRYDDIKDDVILDDIAKYSYYQSLIDLGYDLGVQECLFEKIKVSLPSKITKYGTLFSPFSTINNIKLESIFEFVIPTRKRESAFEIQKEDMTDTNDSKYPFRLVESSASHKNNYSEKLEYLLSNNTREDTAKIIKNEVRFYKKEEFYPWISEVFSVLGISCNIPQHGNNSVRWDAILLNEDNSDTVPIELKSPTEEINISTKAIRQALENKVVLQSRKALANKFESATLAIGFELPNKRSEVESLIRAFHKSFGFNVAVLSVGHLINLTIKCVEENKKLGFSDFVNLKGIVNE